ncbi:MAG: hypothetical protein IPK55_10600 [Streptococcus sp.]|nr:hypothetical protein [Streptococcus sp.]
MRFARRAVAIAGDVLDEVHAKNQMKTQLSSWFVNHNSINKFFKDAIRNFFDYCEIFFQPFHHKIWNHIQGDDLINQLEFWESSDEEEERPKEKSSGGCNVKGT